MLFKQEVLQKIKRGEITLAFRKWQKPTVKKGSIINTPMGQVIVQDISQVLLADITQKDLRQAGVSSIEELSESFYHKTDGDVYRIEVTFAGPDPRIELRNKANLSDQELQDIRLKLDRYDKFSKVGPWTLKVLNLIAEHPHKKAADLARTSGFEKEWLKVNIRKLKNMGLTISHNPGYELSPRGQVAIHFIKDSSNHHVNQTKT